MTVGGIQILPWSKQAVWSLFLLHECIEGFIFVNPLKGSSKYIFYTISFASYIYMLEASVISLRHPPTMN